MWFISNPLSLERTQNLLIMELCLPLRLSLTHTHTLLISLLYFFPFLSFSGFQLISFPQLQSRFHQQKELHRLLKAMPLSALLPSQHYTQWRAATSLSLYLSAPNWLGAAGPRGQAGPSQPFPASDHWTKVEPPGFKCHTHLLLVKAAQPWESLLGAGLTQQEWVCSRMGTDSGVYERLVWRGVDSIAGNWLKILQIGKQRFMVHMALVYTVHYCWWVVVQLFSFKYQSNMTPFQFVAHQFTK